ncbi:MAG: methyltransferase [Myxococcota bacterium]
MRIKKNAPTALLLSLATVLSLGCARSESEVVAPASATLSGAGDEVVGDALTLDAIVAGATRSPENKARDEYRHPVETLTFFGVEPDMHVLEVRPGGGWYTEILALFLKEKGQLTVGVPSAEGRRAKYRNRFIELKATRPDILGEVEIATFDPPSQIDLGPDGSVDMVLTFRNTHNWISDGGEEEAYAAFFDVLRPGGVLGVVQHRADDGANPGQSAKNGYVPESYVIAVAEKAGFELVGSSDINRNERDTHDHPAGVWTLPPVLRLGDTGRAQYEEIGESDRMTLKFRKPSH